MAFNNDISVTDVFDKLYGQVTGTKADGVNELEVCYCIGLGLGIILFFNHVGRKEDHARSNADPDRDAEIRKRCGYHIY